MAENKKTSRLLRFYDAYGKRLDVISFAVIISSIAICSFSVSFQILYVEMPLFGTTSIMLIIVNVIPILHGILTIKLALKEMHAHKILHTARIEVYVLLVGLVVALSFILFILIQPYLFPSPITGALFTMFFWVFLSFYLISLFSAILVLFYLLIPSSVKARLCFIATKDSLRTLHRLEHLERRKYINKYFKWFKLGLHYYNGYIMGEMPNHPQIKEINSYYDSAYLLALTGNAKELKDLENYINEVDESLRKQDFRRFLISLQHMKGKKTKKEVSIYQLSNLFRTVSLSSRIVGSAKKVAAIFVVIITLIAGIIQIMKSLGM